MAVRSKLVKLDEGVVMAAPTDRVRVIYDNRNHPTQKEILYIGFHDFETAKACYEYLLAKGMLTRYDYKTDRGICKPRRSERVETCQWELKVHRPDPELVALFVNKSLVKVEPAKVETTNDREPAKVETQQPTNDRAIKIKPIVWDNDPYSDD